MWKSFSLVLVAAGALAVPLTGCGTTHASTVTSVPGTATVVVVSEPNAGKTVHVQVGDKVELLLHSSYWTIAPSPDPSALAEHGKPVYLKPSRACPPGVGCAPVEVTFTADKPGTVMLTASRISCGEAMMCGPSQRHYQVIVDIAS
jgi:hypothetical protein